MLVRPKFKIMTPEQAEDYYNRLRAYAERDTSEGKENSYYNNRIREIDSFAKWNNLTKIEACIDLNQISIGDTDFDNLIEKEPGVYVGSWINIEHEFDYDGKGDFENLRDPKFFGKSMSSCYPSEWNHMIPFDYGVCDTPEQFLNYKYTPGDFGRWILNNKKLEITPEIELELETEITLGEYLRNSDRKFAVGFNPIKQDPENPGGGWRWHKWGTYIGKHNICCEYLDDEDLSDINQDYILCFHIYEFKDAEPVENKKPKIKRK